MRRGGDLQMLDYRTKILDGFVSKGSGSLMLIWLLFSLSVASPGSDAFKGLVSLAWFVKSILGFLIRTACRRSCSAPYGVTMALSRASFQDYMMFTLSFHFTLLWPCIISILDVQFTNLLWKFFKYSYYSEARLKDAKPLYHILYLGRPSTSLIRANNTSIPSPKQVIASH